MRVRLAGWPLHRESRSEEHTSELQSLRHLVCRLLLEKKNTHKRALRLGSPEGKVFELPGESEVLVGDPAGRLRFQLQPPFSRTDSQLRCMPGGPAQAA